MYMKKTHFGEALALSAALAGGDTTQRRFDSAHLFEERPVVEQQEMGVEEEPLKDFILQTEVKKIFKNPEFFVYHEDGEFSEQEKSLRTEKIDGTGTIFHDVGLDFYVVQKGETLDEIRTKLTASYPYLQKQTRKIDGFNIGKSHVSAEMMLPIPLEKDERKISDQEFLKFAYETIEEMEDDPEYGEFIHALREHYSDEKIAISLLAIAKQESGGKPIGQFELHRFEPKYQTFSYSIFHVLMIGPGEAARKELGMTLGQTYHPGNAIKLFFAFAIEKILEPKAANRENLLVRENAKKQFVELFEFTEKSVASINGRAWKRYNPEYLQNIHGYYGEAQHYFGENGILVASLETRRNTP